jgi:hypothetical protein
MTSQILVDGKHWPPFREMLFGALHVTAKAIFKKNLK